MQPSFITIMFVSQVDGESWSSALQLKSFGCLVETDRTEKTIQTWTAWSGTAFSKITDNCWGLWLNTLEISRDTNCFCITNNTMEICWRNRLLQRHSDTDNIFHVLDRLLFTNDVCQGISSAGSYANDASHARRQTRSLFHCSSSTKSNPCNVENDLCRFMKLTLSMSNASICRQWLFEKSNRALANWTMGDCWQKASILRHEKHSSRSETLTWRRYSAILF